MVSSESGVSKGLSCPSLFSNKIVEVKSDEEKQCRIVDSIESRIGCVQNEHIELQNKANEMLSMHGTHLGLNGYSLVPSINMHQ